MSRSSVLVKAPSNIALIKYMGKADSAINLPANESLSLTLDQLCTYVEIFKTTERGVYRYLAKPPQVCNAIDGKLRVPDLSSKAVSRMMDHVDRVIRNLPELFSAYGLMMDDPAGLEILSANTFPHAVGIASSASSFAAITLAIAAAGARHPGQFVGAYERETDLRLALAQISRQGSGSSCRSFFGPWVSWSGERVDLLPTQLPPLVDFVIVLNEDQKKISSSEAHLRVQSSPLWEGRVKRVSRRAKHLRKFIENGDWRLMGAIVLDEALEMHALFHTSLPSFSYWSGHTIQALARLNKLSDQGPIITLDAGPNIHFLVPEAEKEKWANYLAREFSSFEILEDRQGIGAQVVRWK